MAVSVVTSSSGALSGFDTSITVSIDATGCNFVEAVVWWRSGSGQACTGMTHAGNAMTSQINVNDGSILFGCGVAKFYIATPTSGSQNVVASFDAAVGAGTTMIVRGYSGVDTGSPYRGSTVTDASDSPHDSVSVTISSDAADLTISDAGIRGGTDVTVSITGGQTNITTNDSGQSGGDAIYAACSYEAGAASVTSSYGWTPSASYNGGMIIDSLKASAGGGSSGTSGRKTLLGVGR